MTNKTRTPWKKQEDETKKMTRSRKKKKKEKRKKVLYITSTMIDMKMLKIPTHSLIKRPI